MTPFTRILSRACAALTPSPWMELSGWRCPSFRVCGAAGFIVAVVFGLVISVRMEMPPALFIAIAGIMFLATWGLLMANRILAGEEIIVSYRCEFVALASCALFLQVTGRPVLPWLDIATLTLAASLVCGKLGCLAAGCCHGRPSTIGVRYGIEHANAGFPAYLVNVALFPIQLVESVFVLCLVIAGSMVLLNRYPPGSTLAFYSLFYAVGRSCLEFVRGDTERNYLWTFSEAQWTSLVVAIAIVVAERARILPRSNWHWIIAVWLGSSMVLVFFWRHLDQARKYNLLHPCHIWEIAMALEHVEQSAHLSDELGAAERIHVARTSLGYKISVSSSTDDLASIKHYSVSMESGSPSLTEVRALARLIGRLAPQLYPCTIVAGRAGVFHILFKAPDYATVNI